jgi:hypothetical protein
LKSPSLTKRMQISDEELERRWAVAPRRSPKTLSLVSRCRISPGWLCMLSSGWRRLEGGATKETSRERQKEHAHSRSGRSLGIAWEQSRHTTKPPCVVDKDMRRVCTLTANTYPTQLVHQGKKNRCGGRRRRSVRRLLLFSLI